MRISLLFFMIIIINACVKQIELKEGNNSSLVLNSIISPDSIFKVNVSQVRSIGATEAYLIDNAVVSIFSDDTLLFTLSHSNNGWYKSYYKPMVNKSYTIKVDAVNTNLSASTSIPEKVAITEANIALGDINENDDMVSKISLSFTDDPSVENYYELIWYTGVRNKTIIHYFNYYRMNDPVILNEGDWEYEPTTLFFSDQLFNGQSVSLNFDVTIGFTTAWSDYDQDFINVAVDNLYANLRSISKEYYLYRKYWTRHYFNQQNDNHTDDPLILLFKGDPIEMYTNVENGYGVFGGFSETIKKVKSKSN
ncbi:MAG: DUF4249 domain-containing protein [Salinivirgaceae bacterium]|nr:DUF4249 domain-containing protein [Salinivirgaceae bacterium]